MSYPQLKRKALLLVFPRATNLEITLNTGDQSLSLMLYTKLDLPVLLTDLKEHYHHNLIMIRQVSFPIDTWVTKFGSFMT